MAGGGGSGWSQPREEAPPGAGVGKGRQGDTKFKVFCEQT